MENNIKNAFLIVQQTFIELGYLFRDFESELEMLGLESLQTGNEIGTEQSKSLNNADRWLFPYVARFYGTSKNNKSRMWYAGASMIHYGQNNTPITPRFLIGVLKKEKPIYKEFYPWWVSSMYRSDYERIIMSSNEKPTESISDDSWHKVIHVSEGGKGSEKWYDEGYIYSVKLTDINDKQDVAKLAKNLSDKYKELNY